MITSIWTRKSIFCSYENCEDKLIEQNSEAFRVTYRTKSERMYSAYFHLDCYSADQRIYLSEHYQEDIVPHAGPGKVKLYTPEQARVRRSLNTQLYNLMSKRRQAYSINSDDWMRVLNNDYSRLMERYDNEAGGRPKTYRGFRL